MRITSLTGMEEDTLKILYHHSKPVIMETRRLQCLPVQNAKCLRRINGELKLKKSHEYYYQIQGQLGLTGMQWSDLMVLCKDDYHIERIYFDQEFFDSMCTNLNKFYFEFFLCTLL